MTFLSDLTPLQVLRTYMSIEHAHPGKESFYNLEYYLELFQLDGDEVDGKSFYLRLLPWDIRFAQQVQQITLLHLRALVTYSNSDMATILCALLNKQFSREGDIQSEEDDVNFFKDACMYIRTSINPAYWDLLDEDLKKHIIKIDKRT